ncbi:MAG: VOC family protein [Paracoccus sp. (in: a-proteobacteria)]|uniref:VOC family protein n=1 Tax=Paracoccus sp. TaxID=267 RepID=UPI0026DF7EF8|nr:VOC family protein [Paracoccus sp. (in: a-proteobacteria)]MDO5632941.1 VOC family protein [Paracoccus sp. (in: a-proteobacteria)]
MLYHQGRLIDHIHLRVTDFGRACDFYLAIFQALGIDDRMQGGRDWLELDELFIDGCAPGQAPSLVHLCFQAADRDAVQRFHTTGLAAGGRDNGAPGLRNYHPGYYAAYLLDPDGNNIEAKVDERVRQRSAPAIRLTD